MVRKASVVDKNFQKSRAAISANCPFYRYSVSNDMFLMNGGQCAVKNCNVRLQLGKGGRPLPGPWP